MNSSLIDRYQRLRNHPDIQKLLDRGGRVFVAMERRQEQEIGQLFALGHRCFAGKYMQETRNFYPMPPGVSREAVTLHLYGHLQRNKAGPAVRLCQAVESLDRADLAHRLRHVINHTPQPLRLRSVLVQINIGREPQKSGVAPDQADALVALVRDLALPLTGVMAIPPQHQSPVMHFRWLRRFADRHDLPDVHMGMSDDFALAIRQGATAVRIGRFLFGNLP